MARQIQNIRYTVIGLVAFVALMAGIFVAQHWQRGSHVNPATFHGTWLETARPVNTFELTGTDGKPFTNDSLQGQWTLMFFGFTNCGYLCPTTMAELGKTYRLLADKGVSPLPKVVMITIDPARDSLHKLNSYVHAFDQHFFGARGDTEMVKQMTNEMGVVYTRVASGDDQNSENYDFQHSGAVMVFNPKGELNAFFTTPHNASDIAADYRAMLG
ncbi:MAG: SCO family protein [Legionellaceae bacterium]|nr:SCO family protein [Legionellaceae bacterium]